MVVHPGNGTCADTLCHALLHHCGGKLSEINGTDRPGIVHRLDRDTSGLIVAAKTDTACLKMIKLFKERTVKKRYKAILSGIPKTPGGKCSGPIGRHPHQRTRMSVVESGKAALTEWELKEAGEEFSLVDCNIHTGRTHQIRVHMSHLGHPIVGDRLYGYQDKCIRKRPCAVDRPLLHAAELRFEHPVTSRELHFESPLPSDFFPWLKALGFGT